MEWSSYLVESPAPRAMTCSHITPTDPPVDWHGTLATTHWYEVLEPRGYEVLGPRGYVILGPRGYEVLEPRGYE